jgi:outer membrane receptor protein involved in Fe transport
MSKWPGRRMLASSERSTWWRTTTSISASLFLLASIRPTGAGTPSEDGQTTGNLKQLSLEALGNLAVTTATKEPEPLRKVPAAIYVITQEDIRRSGATTLPDVLRLAPGVEIAQVDSDHWSIAIRGFGAVLASRLLVLIDSRFESLMLFRTRGMNRSSSKATAALAVRTR